jgi:MFS family permease
MVHSSFFYLSTIFVLGYAVKALGMVQSSITSGTTIANIIEMCAVPLIAGFSDKLGRRPFIILGIVLAAVWYPIFFQIVLTKDAFAIMGGFVISLGLIHALMFAPEAAFTAELFPTRVRASGSSLGKQLGIVLGGGLAPLIGAALMGSGTSFTPVVLYFEAIALLALIEIGVLRGQCLDRRIDDPKRLRREITAWERQRNAARSRIKWMFTTDKARAKMAGAYPATPKES